MLFFFCFLPLKRSGLIKAKCDELQPETMLRPALRGTTAMAVLHYEAYNDLFFSRYSGRVKGDVRPSKSAFERSTVLGNFLCKLTPLVFTCRQQVA